MITNFGRSSRNLFRKEIAEANPKSSVALNDLAQSYEDGGNRQQALALYKASVAINPFDSYAAECLRAIPRTTTL